MTMSNIYVDRTTTWHAVGKDVQECKNMEQVLRKSGLDYTVTKAPVYNFDGVDYNRISNRFITTRDNDGHTYDVVSDKFEVIQNWEAFDFVNYIGEDIQFEKAGETANGMVYVIAKLPEVNILGDAFVPHVIFRNGFSGKVKITAAITPLRLVCQNQFNFAFKHADNTITIRHVQNAQSKLEEAKETLRLSADYMQELTKTAEHFAAIPMNSDRIHRVMDILFPMPEGVEMNAFKRATLENARERFMIAHEAKDNANFRDTAWGLVNAYTDYMTHKEPAKTKAGYNYEGRFVNTTFKVAMNPVFEAIEMVR